MKIKGFLFYAVLLVMTTSVAGAAENIEKQQQRTNEGAQVQEAATKSRFIPGKVLFYADLYEGFDNNVNLDSSRKHDLFTEADMELGYKYPVTDDFNTTADYYLNSVNYSKVTDATYYDNNGSLNFDTDIFDKKANLAFNNRGEYNYYPHEDRSAYFLYNPELSIKYNFNKSVFQKLTYDFTFREYSDRKATEGSGADKNSDLKEVRNGITYDVAGLFFKDIFVKVRNQYFVNDSNDQFMDYYDYWAYRFNTTAIIPFLTDRLYSVISFGYQRSDYDSRQLVNDSSKTEKDDLYYASSSVIFDVTKKVSVSLNYTYRQNESNEPSQKYSGSIISAGFHYAF